VSAPEPERWCDCGVALDLHAESDPLEDREAWDCAAAAAKANLIDRFYTIGVRQ
jgi:hypothetical protein